MDQYEVLRCSGCQYRFPNSQIQKGDKEDVKLPAFCSWSRRNSESASYQKISDAQLRKNIKGAEGSTKYCCVAFNYAIHQELPLDDSPFEEALKIHQGAGFNTNHEYDPMDPLIYGMHWMHAWMDFDTTSIIIQPEGGRKADRTPSALDTEAGRIALWNIGNINSCPFEWKGAQKELRAWFAGALDIIGRKIVGENQMILNDYSMCVSFFTTLKSLILIYFK